MSVYGSIAICKMEFHSNSVSICQVIQVGIQICADPQKVWIPARSRLRRYLLAISPKI